MVSLGRQVGFERVDGWLDACRNGQWVVQHGARCLPSCVNDLQAQQDWCMGMMPPPHAQQMEKGERRNHSLPGQCQWMG